MYEALACVQPSTRISHTIDDYSGLRTRLARFVRVRAISTQYRQYARDNLPLDVDGGGRRAVAAASRQSSIKSVVYRRRHTISTSIYDSAQRVRARVRPSQSSAALAPHAHSLTRRMVVLW